MRDRPRVLSAEAGLLPDMRVLGRRGSHRDEPRRLVPQIPRHAVQAFARRRAQIADDGALRVEHLKLHGPARCRPQRKIDQRAAAHRPAIGRARREEMHRRLGRGRCALLERRESPLLRWLQHGYEAALERTLRMLRPALLAIGVLATSAFSLAGLAVLPSLGGTPVLPSFKEPNVMIQWQAPPGTSYPEMARITTVASRELRTIPGVRNVAAVAAVRRTMAAGHEAGDPDPVPGRGGDPSPGPA